MLLALNQLFCVAAVPLVQGTHLKTWGHRGGERRAWQRQQRALRAWALPLLRGPWQASRLREQPGRQAREAPRGQQQPQHWGAEPLRKRLLLKMMALAPPPLPPGMPLQVPPPPGRGADWRWQGGSHWQGDSRILHWQGD